jgi:rhodanese-related sulfurtransferase
LTAFALPAAAEEEAAERYRNPEALAALIEAGEPEHLILDVRTPGEFESGHIPTAENLPVSTIAENPPEVPADRLIVVYCRSGNRSARAARILQEQGYSRVVDFGGIYRWQGRLD